MCGIVGYIGEKNAPDILLEGLSRLEYRGYDSAGLAYLQDGEMHIRKQEGKISELADSFSNGQAKAQIGIGHTRWATHGVPNTVNAHPHSDCTGDIALVHNGIIENYKTLKRSLIEKGHVFKTDTDTEVLAHLIEEEGYENLVKSVSSALEKVVGAYGIACIAKWDPKRIVVARSGSPLVIGVNDDEYFIASDAAALVKYTRDVCYLEDGQIGVLSLNGTQRFNIYSKKEIPIEFHNIPFDLQSIEKKGYEHFMLKEINEQSDTIRDAMRGRLLPDQGSVRLGGIKDHLEQIESADHIYLTACGTSWHAALIGEYLFEEFLRIPVEVEYASEFRYRNPIITENTVVIGISQSGETADTLAALRLAKEKGALCLGICNVVGSTIARETDAGIYIHAGPEIGVASTKAFTSQLTVLNLLSLLLARRNGMSKERGETIVSELQRFPEIVDQMLSNIDDLKEMASYYADKSNFLYLGRGYQYPVALEGAVKLKEISYIHAEGYPAAEMKHGPIALIDDNMPVVFIAPKDETYDKVVSNMEEVKARGGHIIALATEGDTEIESLAEHVIRIPDTENFLLPILTTIPLQLLAYYIATERDCEVDQPRNLAKSVTVE